MNREAKINILKRISDMLETYTTLLEKQSVTNDEVYIYNRLITCLITINHIIDEMEG